MGRFRIANCKLQISNCNRITKPPAPGEENLSSGGRSLKPICHLHFSICNVQCGISYLCEHPNHAPSSPGGNRLQEMIQTPGASPGGLSCTLAKPGRAGTTRPLPGQ